MSTLLDLGFIAVTRGVHDVSLEHTPFHHWVLSCIDRFRLQDWGDNCQEDSTQNVESVIDGSRILASYDILEGLCGVSDRIWIIAERVSPTTGQRDYTTILYPQEY